MDNARKKALEVLLRWEKRGSPMDPLFHTMIMTDPRLTHQDRAFVRELVYGVLRWRKKLDWIISTYSSVPPRKIERALLPVLRMGTYQLLYLDRTPDHAVVDEAVKLAKGIGKGGAAAFVNGLLRGIAEGRKEVAYPDLDEDPVNHISTYYSHPFWMVRRWIASWGVDETIALCKANNQLPPFTVRVNTLKVQREEVIEALRKKAVRSRPTPHSPVGLIVDNPPPLSTWPPLQEGLFYVQDEASQLVSYLVAPQPTERILDVCAAPGGKTTHLAQLMRDQGEIVALDVSPSKLSILKTNCRRLGITLVKTKAVDATRPLPFPTASFDKILIDVPCTGLGTLRRNPDAKWRVKETDVQRLQTLQRQILEQTAPLVKPAGMLVYSTCTLTVEENEGVIEPFLRSNSGFFLESASGLLPPCCTDLTDKDGCLRTLPHLHGTDGFFAARMRRS